MKLVLSCEHATAHFPARYRKLLRHSTRVLDTHRACDLGALEVARKLTRLLHAPLTEGTISRLLVDLNRPLGHPRLFPWRERGLSSDDQQELLREFHAPYWQAVRRSVSVAQRGGQRVLHVSVHSFTPVLNGERRQADLGILYDPGRRGELLFAKTWQRHLAESLPNLRTRRNYPYRGVSAGLTQQLRLEFPPRSYVGLELELGQHRLSTARERSALARAIATSLTHTLRRL